MTDADNPNAVPYEDDDAEKGAAINGANSRPGTGKIWTVEGDEALQDPNQEDSQDTASIDTGDGLSEADTKILLEKEFDDYYEDRVHKSAGPVVFLSKTLGMLPVIWTDDDEESDCKTYFNLYTFIIFFGWVGLSVLCGIRVGEVTDWPAERSFTGVNATDPMRFMGRMTMDTYIGAVFTNCIVAVLFGVFKSRSFAEVLYTTSEVDGQLELQEKHYEKIKQKSIYWIGVEVVLMILHCVGLFFLMEDMGKRDLFLFVCLTLANFAGAVLDLQYIHMTMVLCKRYRMMNKVIGHICKPFKTFRNEEPTHAMLQDILQYRWEAVKKEEQSNRFDQIWEPSLETPDVDPLSEPVKVDITKQTMPPALCLKGSDKEISREEENTFILQLDILRGIHSDLHNVGQEINHLLGFQMLVNLMSSTIVLIMFGFYFTSSALSGWFYWPLLILIISPAVKIMLIGHWAQVMKDTSMKPFWAISQMSTLDGSPRMERQVQKFSLQASQRTARLTAAGYFAITRVTITKLIGWSMLVILILVKFEKLESVKMMTS